MLLGLLSVKVNSLPTTVAVLGVGLIDIDTCFRLSGNP